MKILLFYENINREYEALVLLKHELKKRGHSVRISHFNFHNWGAHFLFSAPDIIATPWLRYDENIARWGLFLRRKKSTKLVNLQWEQVYSRKGLESGLADTHGEALKAYHLCWGERSVARLKNSGISEKNLYINGPLQFDMCRPEYRSYFKERKELAAEFTLPADKPWGLYISSFSFATLRPEQLAEIEKVSGNYRDFVDLSIRSRNKTLDWIENFMQQNPEKVFIYRPHPAEHSDQRISEMEKRYPNFHVISQYSVKQWILACEYIGVWISTSCSEVYALGKNCKIFRPEELSDYYDLEYMINAKTYKSEKEFSDYFAGKSCEYDFPVSEALLKEYYDFSPDSSSATRTAEIFEKIAASSEEQKFNLTSENAVAFKKTLPARIIISLLTSIYQFSFLPLGKILPLSFLKRCDAFFAREKRAISIEKNLMTYIKDKGL